MNKRNIKTRKVINVDLGIRVVLLFVFLISSILKFVNIHSFALETRLYINAYMADWMRSCAMVCAITVSSIEMLMALLSIRKEYIRLVTFGFFLALSFFLYLTGINLFFPSIMGSIESCGCFGELIHFTPTTSFIKSVALWVIAFVLVVTNYKNNEPWNITLLLRDEYLYVCAMVSVVLPLYSLWFFNEMSHTAYIIGFVTICSIISFVVFWEIKHTSKGIT